MTYGDLAWRTGRLYIGWPTRVFTRARVYGVERVPPEGGLVYAVNHMHWVDIPVFGAVSPRKLVGAHAFRAYASERSWISRSICPTTSSTWSSVVSIKIASSAGCIRVLSESSRALRSVASASAPMSGRSA